MADIFDQVAGKGGGAPAAAAPPGDIFDRVAAQQAPPKLSDTLIQPHDADAQTTANAARAAMPIIPGLGPAPGAPRPPALPEIPGIMQRALAPLTHGGIAQQLEAAGGPAPHLQPSRAEREAPAPGLDTPAVDFTQWTGQKPGATHAAADFASGLTSPENMMAMAATSGLGTLTKQLGKGIVSRLISAGFSGQMLHGAYQQIPEFRDAWNKENWPVVRETLTRMVLGGGMAALAGRHALKGDAATATAAAQTPAAPEPEQQYTSTGEPVRAPAAAAAAPPAQGDIFDRVAESSKENGNAEKIKVQSSPAQEGKPAAVAESGEPAAAGGAAVPAADAGAAGQAPGAAAEKAVGEAPAEPRVSQLQVHPEIAPYFEKSTNEFRGKPEAGLAWVRGGPGRFAGGAIPHLELPGGIGMMHGERGDGAPDWRGGFGVSHVDAKRPGHLDEAIHTIPHLPVTEVTTDPKTGRVLSKVLFDGKRRAVVSHDLRGHETPAWLLTSYERPSPATSSGVDEAPAGPGPTPPESGRSSVPLSTGNAPADSGAPDTSIADRQAEEKPSAAAPAKGEAGWVGNMPTDQIEADPVRFQFKGNVGQGGAGDELRDITNYDPEKAGVISVWKDPADGRTYVVNGHNRLAMAKRVGAALMTVRYLKAETAQEARTKGALINIAEGRGESVDAAKVFRDMAASPERLQAEGVSIKGKIAKEGMALAKLSQPIFDDVIDGSLSPARGAVLGDGLDRHSDQKAVYELMKQRERNGKRLTNDQLEEMIRLAKRTSTVTENTADDAQGGLFGSEVLQRSLLPEKAEASDYVRKQLGAEKKLFGAVASEGAATKLAEGGNVIDAKGNAAVADRANRGLFLYDKLSNGAGPIDDILDRAAQKIANGEDANAAKQEAYRQIRPLVLAEGDRLAGIPARSGGGDPGHGEQGPDSGAGVQLPPAGDAAGADKVAAAKARLKARAKELLQSEEGSMTGRFDPRDLEDFIVVAMDYIRQAGEGFEKFSKYMMEEFGRAVLPHLQTAYQAALTRLQEQRSLLASPEERAAQAKQRAAEQAAQAKLLGEQLSAQIKAGGPARPPKVKPAQNRDLFDDGAPETGNLFDPNFMGSGLGGLQPLFERAAAAGEELRARRKEALAEAKKAAGTPEEKRAGEKVRAYFTAERDLWAAQNNQAIDIVTRKVLPKIQDREAVAIAREFRHQPLELQAFIDGTHPFLEDVDGGPAAADKNLAKLIPVLRQAQRILAKPTRAERAADQVYTNIAERDLQEGRKGGWLESRWQSDQYVPHLIHPKGEGEVARPPSTEGKLLGKVGKWFGFGERRADRYPTMVHAVADGLIPKTLDPSAAFTLHSDQFARARATHLLEAHLEGSGLGIWGDGTNAPVGWKQLAAHSEEFKKRQAYAVPNTFDPETGESELRVGTTGLYVPPFVEKAMSAITDPDFTVKIPGFAKLRTAQRGLKEAILGFSGFHLLTENVMAKADIGPAAMYRALGADRQSPEFLADERDLIAAGGTTSIQGSVMDAYRGLRPGTIPTRAEVIRGYIPGSKQALTIADAITRLTFDNVQRRFKVVSFALHRDAWTRANPGATAEQLAEAKKGIASYVNGVYGGLHWENMGIARTMVEVSRALFLAPDWSGSNIALAKYAFDGRLSRAEFGRRRLAGATSKESVQARLARAFWTKQLVQGLTENQMLSLLFSGQLSPRPLQVYQGKDKNGEDVFQNVVFRGSIGDAVSLAGKVEEHGGAGWDKDGILGAFTGTLLGAGVFTQGKMAPMTKLAIHALTTRDDFGHPITPFGLAADASPVPIAARSLFRMSLDDDSDKYLWSERVLGLLGPMGQHVAPRGMRMEHGELVEKHYR